MTAHEELRARLDDYRKAVAVYESPDPHDREEARYEAMHAAQARLCDLALAEALLDEIDTLRAGRPIETAPFGKMVLVHGVRFRAKSPAWHVAKLDDLGWVDRDGHAIHVPTHWMPLPEAP